jgi:hypothetical protein
MARMFSSDPVNGRIGNVTKDVLEAICREWPVNPQDVAKSLGENGSNKAMSSKYLYHFRKLKRMELIEMKKTGNTYVAWPMDMEKLRVIHEMLKVE